MQLHFSPSMRSITISSSNNGGLGDLMKIKVAARHISYRTLFHTVLILAFLLPFVFILTAVVTLEGVNKCSSFDCLGRRLGPKLLGRADDSGRLVKDFVKILNQVNSEELPAGLKLPESYNHLVSEMKNNKHNAKEFALMVKGMMDRFEREIRESKFAELTNKHFAASSIPKGIHCLSLRLTDEYSSNAHARKQLPSPELLPSLSDNSLHHFVLSTDNILAASVVVNSAVQSSLKPEKIVFHVITDKKTYAGMHSWFALNPVSPAIVEVKSVHQFDWLTRENVPVLEAVETHNGIRNYYHGNHVAGANLSDTTPRSFASKLQARSPKYISLLNHLRIYLPENLKSNLTLWKLGTLPPALIAFKGHVHPIDPSWHMLGLGYQNKTNIENVKKAAVIHYNGQSKPWLEIGFEHLRPFWTKYVNYTNDFVRNCHILE
nr:probable galacturonosyltransferase 13 isoform X2 [Ipomoea batatas]GMC62202.1 probable galacturonosyltransferase 13 isoform X2 [Ipomoea batatas]